MANCAAAALNGRAYVFGGQQSPQSTAAESGLYSLDLNDPEAAWRAEPPLPGPGRILPSVAVPAGALFVAGGAGWRALPDLPTPSCAAPAFGLNGEFFVLGGSDGVLVPRENELRDAHAGFSRSVYGYSAGRGSWRVAAQLPFSLVTIIPAVRKNLLVLPGGEDRPAHRSAQVYATVLPPLEG